MCPDRAEETKLTCQNQAAALNYVAVAGAANSVQRKTWNFDLNLRFIGILDEVPSRDVSL